MIARSAPFAVKPPNFGSLAAINATEVLRHLD
jgi:hypothetical protein